MKQPLFILLSVALACLWTACSPPSQTELQNRLASELPPYLSLKNLEWEASPSGEGRYTCNFRATVQPTEDLYEASSFRPANEIQIQLVERLAENQINQRVFDEASKAIVAFSERHSFLKVVADQATPITLHGRIVALREGKAWQWGFLEWSQAALFAGRPRSAFPTDALAEGRPETTAALDGLRQKIQMIEETEARKQEKAAADRDAKKAAALAMFKPGTKYQGHVKSDHFPDPVILEVVADSEPTGHPLKLRLRNPRDETMYRDFVGVIDTEEIDDPKRPVAKSAAEPPIRNFEDKRALFAPIRTLYGKSAYSLQLFVTETGLRGECSGYGGATLELVRQP